MSIYSETLGQNGQHLLILHGWGRSGADLKPLAEMMSETNQVHLIDLPGFGRSPHPGSDWSAIDYANALVRYCDDHGIGSFNLMGHSFGGKVCIALASHYPERVLKVVLMSSAGLKNKLTSSRKIKRKGIAWLGKGIKLWDQLSGSSSFKTWFTPRYGSANYRDAGDMKNILVKTVNEDYTAYISKIQSPVLILWGAWDSETFPESGVRMSRLIPHSRLIIFPQKDHYFPQGVGGHLVGRYAAPFFAESGA